MSPTEQQAAGILLVGVDSTTGWGASTRCLHDALQRAGVNVRMATTGPVPRVRTFMLTDLVQAWLARRAARRAIALHEPEAIIYCSITAALLWPRPGAIWLDSIAAENRPGRHGIWQRIVERRRLHRSPLVLTMSERALDGLRGRHPETVVVPAPIAPSAPPASSTAHRDIAALTYAGNPEKKRLAFILDAWMRARRGDERIIVSGIDSIPSPAASGPLDGVTVVGRLTVEDYRALLRRARVFVAAPTREDYGIAPLEALADGCMLVTTPAPGPYPALDLARALDPRLVSDDIARALRIALDDPREDYAQRAAEMLHAFSPKAVDRTLSERVLPRLLAGWSAPATAASTAAVTHS